MEAITIADAHSTHNGKAIKVKTIGSNPVFAYIWINDQCYTISKPARGNKFAIKKTFKHDS